MVSNVILISSTFLYTKSSHTTRVRSMMHQRQACVPECDMRQQMPTDKRILIDLIGYSGLFC